MVDIPLFEPLKLSPDPSALHIFLTKSVYIKFPISAIILTSNTTPYPVFLLRDNTEHPHQILSPADNRTSTTVCGRTLVPQQFHTTVPTVVSPTMPMGSEVPLESSRVLTLTPPPTEVGGTSTNNNNTTKGVPPTPTSPSSPPDDDAVSNILFYTLLFNRHLVAHHLDDKQHNIPPPLTPTPHTFPEHFGNISPLFFSLLEDRRRRLT
jgi:hypothetical protein